jgi:DNA repair protein RadC
MPRRPRATTTTCGPVIAEQAVHVCVTRPREPGPALRHSEQACDVLRRAAASDRESLYALYLNNQNQVLGVEEIAKGGTGAVEFSVGEAFRGALVAGAPAVIVGHNHPSGNPEPSPADEDLTRRLIAAGKLVGVKVLDHVIVAEKGCHSFQRTGAIAGLEGLGDVGPTTQAAEASPERCPVREPEPSGTRRRR